jgi:hypothetical protein
VIVATMAIAMEDDRRHLGGELDGKPAEKVP